MTRPLLLLSFFCSLAVSRADIAVLHERGPWSGALGSTPGLVKSDDLQPLVSMQDADVKISLEQKADFTLEAQVHAKFTLRNHEPHLGGPKQIAVAFPVTGLTSKIVQIKDFSVTTDSSNPSVILRRMLSVNRYQLKAHDIPITVSFDRSLFKKLSEQEEKDGRGIELTDKQGYLDSYIWGMLTKPGEVHEVIVEYNATITPQSLHYENTYERDPRDADVIPSNLVQVKDKKRKYYFFDYILISGTTWDGPIGNERIVVSFIPLQKSLNKTITAQLTDPMSDSGLAKPHGEKMTFAQGSDGDSQLIFEVKGKPSGNLLFTIEAPSPSAEVPK